MINKTVVKKIVWNRCSKCKWEWKQRGKRVPKCCPSCHNPNWNKIDTKQMVKLIIGDFWK